MGYAQAMASDRMTQAIGALERAIDRLEQDVARRIEAPGAGIDQAAAKAALRSLDDLIETLEARAHG